MSNKPADPPLSSVEEQLAHMTPQMLACRDLGHNWQRGVPLHATATRGKKVMQAERVIRCEGNCGCVRTDTFERDGNGMLIKMYGTIAYPPGYLLTRDDPDVPTGRISANVARSTFMAKLAPDLTW